MWRLLHCTGLAGGSRGLWGAGAAGQPGRAGAQEVGGRLQEGAERYQTKVTAEHRVYNSTSLRAMEPRSNPGLPFVDLC
jgi:hypothetical protein